MKSEDFFMIDNNEKMNNRNLSDGELNKVAGGLFAPLHMRNPLDYYNRPKKEPEAEIKTAKILDDVLEWPTQNGASFNNDEEIKEKIENGLLYCWDPITAAYILSPKICKDIETRYVYVEPHKGPSFGLTLSWAEGLQPEGTYKADVVLSVDRDKFWEFFYEISDALI